jgi:ABC-type branched-subunit amino acid transport system ATPase component/branched-subunit amino acid ABC-type transport system permease component
LVDKFLNLLFSGAVSGGIYAVMAAGVVLTYQTSGIFNFAHGAVAFVTAYFFFQLNTGLDVPVVPAALISVLIFAPLLGLALDRILLRRLATAPVYARIVGSIGLLIALPALSLWLVEALGNTVLDLGLPVTTGTGNATVRGIGPFPRETWHLDAIGLDGVSLNSDQVAVFVAALLAAIGLWIVLRHTRLGLEMRAVVNRSDLAGLRGVNASRTSSAAWILTMMLAGIGGILIAPLFQLADQQFTLIVLGSLAAVSLAGLRSIPVAFVGGLLLGVLQNLLYGYGDTILPTFLNELAGLRAAIPFFLTVILLFVVGRNKGAESRSVSEERPMEDHRDGLPRWRRLLPWAVFLFLFVGFTLQWFPWGWAQASDFEALGILAPGMALAIVFLSFVVVTGLGGMVSLAQGTFVTAGGFAAGWAVNHDFGIDVPFVASHGQINFAAAAVLGSLAAGALGALIAVPVRRLGVLALALASLAIALALDLTLFQMQDVSNGQLGWLYPLPRFDVFGITTIDLSYPRTSVMVLLVIFGVMTLGIHNLQKSSSGRAALAVRSSSVAARTSGIAPARSEIALFAVAGGIAGFGGVMLGMTNGTFTNTSATPITGLLWLAVVVTFGIRRPGGALLGGLAVMATTPVFQWISGWSFMPGWFNDLSSSTYFASIMFGLGAINLAKNPDGLFALVGSQRLERRRTKEREARVALAEIDLHAVEHAPVNGADPTDATTTTDGDPMHLRGVVGEESFGHVDQPVPTADAALALDDVVAGYGDVEVLHGVTLHLAPGSVVALLGANGAGKSTLCGIVAGLLTPSSGTVSLAGQDVTALAPFQRSRAGVMLAPEARGIFPGLSVEENLEVLLRSKEARAQAYEIFPILGERLHQQAGLLSGGEQQMLSLAPALVNPPAVFVADEPTLGLAPLAADEIMTAIRRLRDLGSTILLVEEKAHEVLEVADTVAFMELGRLVWMGPCDQLDEERLAGTYLGMGS